VSLPDVHAALDLVTAAMRSPKTGSPLLLFLFYFAD
jgi:hypothetical protein